MLMEQQTGVLHFGGTRMALFDIKEGFWGLRRQMEALVGQQLTDTAMRQAGANGGAAFARAFAPDVTVETAVSTFCDCVAAYQSAGFGQFDVDILEWPIGRVLVHGRNTFEAWMMQQHHHQIEQPACAYTAGVFVGFLNAITNRRDIVCRQHHCQALGAESCAFELIPATEADRTAVVPVDPNPGPTDKTDTKNPLPQGKAQNRELSALLAITQDVASALDLDSMLGRILEQFKAVVDYDGAAVLGLDGNVLKILAYHSPLPQDENQQRQHFLTQSIAHQAVIQRREPVIIPDVCGDTPLACALQTVTAAGLDTVFNDMRSWIGVPLISRDQVIGLLSLDHDLPDFYTGRHSLLAMTFANKVAVAIENSRLYKQVEQAAATAERNRLARELHDAVTQTLFSAGLIADVLPRIWERDQEQGRERLAELKELTRGALAEMRTLLLELRPSTLTESSLAELLRQLIQAFGSRSRLPIDLIIEGERPLPPETQTTLYRIAQEALNNITKHAGANQAILKLLFSPQAVNLSIHDDGRGFDPSDASLNSLGLGIMRERAEKIGAQLTINSRIGEGTTVTVYTPVANDNEEDHEGR